VDRPNRDDGPAKGFGPAGRATEGGGTGGSGPRDSRGWGGVLLQRRGSRLGLASEDADVHHLAASIRHRVLHLARRRGASIGLRVSWCAPLICASTATTSSARPCGSALSSRTRPPSTGMLWGRPADQHRPGQVLRYVSPAASSSSPGKRRAQISMSNSDPSLSTHLPAQPSSRPVTDLRPEWESEKLDRLAGGQQASCDATG